MLNRVKNNNLRASIAVLIALFVGLGINLPIAGAQSAPFIQSSNVTSVTQAGVTFVGTVNPNNSPATFWFEYGTSGSYGYSTPPQNVGSGNQNILVTYSVSNLSYNTTYYFRMVAQNQYGVTQGQQQTFSTSGNQTNIPSLDTNSASNITQTSANLSGFLRGNIDDQTYTWFEYGTSPDYLNLSTSQIFSGTTVYTQNYSSSFTQPLTNLQSGMTYYFRAAARNRNGTSYGQLLQFTTWGGNNYNNGVIYTNPYTYYPYNNYCANCYTSYSGYLYGQAPVVTTNVSSNANSGTATLQGTVNPNGIATTAWFEYGPSSALGQRTNDQYVNANSGLQQVTNSVFGLSSGTNYYYRLAARNQYGTNYGSTLNFQTGYGNAGSYNNYNYGYQDQETITLPKTKRIVYKYYQSAAAPIVAAVTAAPLTGVTQTYPTVAVSAPNNYPFGIPPIYGNSLAANYVPANQTVAAPANNQPIVANSQPIYAASIAPIVGWTATSIIGLVLFITLIFLLIIFLFQPLTRRA